jgi:glutathione peroxidase
MLIRYMFLTVFFSNLATAGLYDVHITTMEGVGKPMSDFRGKKLLVIVLPVTHSAADSQYLVKVDVLSRTYQDSVVVLGVPAYEYGYRDADSSQVRQYYRALLGSQVVLTKGMYVSKSSGTRQHALFSWLTHADQNQQFDLDVRGVGQKYFVNGGGELYGNLSAAVTLRDSLMLKMLY